MYEYVLRKHGTKNCTKNVVKIIEKEKKMQNVAARRGLSFR
jgi:hypothetical protein